MEPVQLGHYELLIRLASGGAANVFLVRDSLAESPGRLVALKILLPSLAANEDFLQMFFTEAKVSARLRHPNVVAIAGFGQVEGIHCLAMEYVFGANLAQVLRASARAKKPLTVGVLLRITACVCDALNYAHELLDEHGQPMGVVHRDVTPQNILIGFNGVPKLTDFGIAKAMNRGWETQAGIVKGKFSYMSPEQALGKRVDRRSDIFGTGIVLWEALTGRDLFRGSTPMEVLSAIQEQKILPPSKVVDGLTPIVDPIVMKALRRAPKARYQTAAEMRDDIEDLIRRAGVQIDASAISREFAAIYGDEIVKRAFALRAAMAGRGDITELAKVLGGQPLSPKHLPVIRGGLTDPDPLGLFSGAREQDDPGIGLPARVDQSFSEAPPTNGEGDFVENTENSRAELLRLEPEGIEPSYGGAAAAERAVTGWDGSTATYVPHDELLSLLSEEDATVGYLPAKFAEHFGEQLERAYKEGQKDFEDEATMGAHLPHLGKLRAIANDSLSRARRERPAPVAPPIPDLGVEGLQVVGRKVSSSPDGILERPVPRAPSLDMDPADSHSGQDASGSGVVYRSRGTPGAVRPPLPPPSALLSSADGLGAAFETEDTKGLILEDGPAAPYSVKSGPSPDPAMPPVANPANETVFSGTRDLGGVWLSPPLLIVMIVGLLSMGVTLGIVIERYELLHSFFGP